MRWMDWSPAWEIHFLYARFDEVLPDGSGLFVDRQVDPGSRLPQMPLIRRESPGMDEDPTGCHVSLAVLPPREEEPRGGELYDASDARTAHQRDWDALVQWRDDLFDKQGILEDAPVFEKVRVLAEYARSRSGPTYASRHPVDLFLHASYCTGKANGLAGMLHTMGIPARTINTPVHSVVEVYDGGRWVLVDNVKPGILISKKSAMEAFAHPEA
ncbi:MAG: transglutaminase domain-containing protein, partial [Candidatus Latescibacteria bacterium]|nr:transglutaminase domain-containing protein [Candidatus Latescibacterota bacterium]